MIDKSLTSCCQTSCRHGLDTTQSHAHVHSSERPSETETKAWRMRHKCSISTVLHLNMVISSNPSWRVSFRWIFHSTLQQTSSIDFKGWCLKKQFLTTEEAAEKRIPQSFNQTKTATFSTTATCYLVNKWLLNYVHWQHDVNHTHCSGAIFDCCLCWACLQSVFHRICSSTQAYDWEESQNIKPTSHIIHLSAGCMKLIPTLQNS
jgi:hypothetical protein